MSYRRYKKRSRGFKYKVQTFFDIATSADSMQVINISCGGELLRQRCAHLFLAYRYFRLGKLSIKFVPASTLPVDPLGLSYDDDDPQIVDPRDQLDCGLVRITNGEDILSDISGLTDTEMQGIYQSMLLDPRWFKFGLQSGFKRTAFPLYWQIGQLHQDMFPGATLNVGYSKMITDDPAVRDNHIAVNVLHGSAYQPSASEGSISNLHGYIEKGVSDPRGFFQVGHRGRMGFLPTEAFVRVPRTNAAGTEVVEMAEIPQVAPIPEVRVITAVLPKMRKTNYYYRCYVTEEITFSGVKHYGPGISGGNYGELDQMVRPYRDAVFAMDPTAVVSLDQIVAPQQRPPNDGGREE